MTDSICSWKRCSSKLILNSILLDDTDSILLIPDPSENSRTGLDKSDFCFLCQDVKNVRNDFYRKSHGKRKKEEVKE